MKTASEPLDTQALDGYLGDELGWLNLNNAVGSLEVAGLRVDAFGVSDAHRGWDKLEVLPELLHDLQADVAPAAVDLGVTPRAVPSRPRLVHRARRRHDLRRSHARRAGAASRATERSSPTATSPSVRHAASATGRTRAQTVPLNVSAGLGHSIYAPVRFACRPEASLITLLPRD